MPGVRTDALPLLLHRPAGVRAMTVTDPVASPVRRRPVPQPSEPRLSPPANR